MNRRQFFGALAGGAVVSKLPAAAPPIESFGLNRQMMLEYANAFDASVSRFDLIYGAGSLNPEFAARVVGGEDDPDDLEDWEVIYDEPEVYVSPRVEAADRLFDIHRAIFEQEKTDA